MTFRGSIILLATAILTPALVWAAPTADELADEFDKVLAPVVAEGRVDYAALKADPKPLDTWLRRIESISKVAVLGWRTDDSKAFYINAYNGHVLRIVRDRYPIAKTSDEFPLGSIQQIPGVWELPLTVAQEDVSLNKIEKTILIAKYGDHRVHFAINCASVGCPPLRDRAYRGKKLGRQLNLAAQDFIRSPLGARTDRENTVLHLSQIFDWYWADFEKLAGTPPYLIEVFAERGPMLGFVASYLPKEEGGFVRDADFWVKYMSYDWTLNERP